jgi:TonB family protein
MISVHNLGVLCALLFLPSVAIAQSDPVDADPMLRCARIRDVASQLRCFDSIKGAKVREPLKAETRGTSNAEQSPPSTSAGDESRHIDRYAKEVARELGKEMYLEDYPQRARDEGRGGTTELLLRVDSNAQLTQLTVSRSSGYSDLDQFALSKVQSLRLPKVPAGIRSAVFSVRLPITFAIRAAAR